MMLAMLFRQHVGYKEVRIPRPGLAFVEFEDEPHATLALKALNGFKLTTTDSQADVWQELNKAGGSLHCISLALY